MHAQCSVAFPVGKEIAVREDGLTCGFCSFGSFLTVIMDEVEWPQIVSIPRKVKCLVMACRHHFAYAQNTTT